ncbi:zinc ribbon domain-containing protein [Halomarina halobia]|uniref:Zinc ribbon domain-containing protein n=1 Tax=Halomarina halobia TaxID=3033386 RepID=A0ABD6AD99_9EURY|nr:zinc ribbon domain-containing protein [Halomarina sp. PSR21]
MEREFTYRCLSCGRRATATRRPNGCQHCGGSLVNETLDRWRLQDTA